ncbi:MULTISPECIES: alpha/beta fold hydrolase [Haloarcula]|uniref:Alpha/beta hydrolase n=1 Tax=Haloarcula pellucida TaxID=1427151 RepID=A0A830GUP6_9EURY|nr:MULTISPECIES: alpha/beta hydrolase [Halomicroarcula]MBX0349377.1 alpha/beta hydrolase [Halomicroarcula pellucida]MDS0279037.1 alpha/beta hydrolase [Halomicroarcula sp. S1AR25-4]GGO03233.1 alpha/beta hydrolase [Halomicroarcula pellucida]
MTAEITSERLDLTVDGDDIDLHYRTGGEGPPMVFLHGIGLDAATVSWRHALPELAEERTVYAPDLPGHGESDKPDRAYTTAYYLETVEAFIDALDIDAPAMAGLSMGGALALGHALGGGDVERLALVDSYGLGADAYWRTAASGVLQTPVLGNMLWQGVSASKPAIRTGLRSMGATEPPQDLVDDVDSVVDRRTVRAMRRWQRSEFRRNGFRTDYSDRLEEVSAPTLLVHGEADPLLPQSWSKRAAATLADSELEIVENCGHCPPRERPERFNRVLRSFC